MKHKEKITYVGDDLTRRGQLLVVTIFLIIFILAAAILLFVGETKDLIPILAILNLTLVTIYIVKIFQLNLKKKDRLLWIILIILFSLFAVPFFWRKHL